MGGRDPVHGRRNGKWRVSAEALEPLAGLRPFDHAHEVERTEGTFDCRDGLVLQFEMVVAQDEVW